jgi:hypothetical protein
MDVGGNGGGRSGSNFIERQAAMLVGNGLRDLL